MASTTLVLNPVSHQAPADGGRREREAGTRRKAGARAGVRTAALTWAGRWGWSGGDAAEAAAGSTAAAASGWHAWRGEQRGGDRAKRVGAGQRTSGGSRREGRGPRVEGSDRTGLMRLLRSATNSLLNQRRSYGESLHQPLPKGAGGFRSGGGPGRRGGGCARPDRQRQAGSPRRPARCVRRQYQSKPGTLRGVRANKAGLAAAGSHREGG